MTAPNANQTSEKDSSFQIGIFAFMSIFVILTISLMTTGSVTAGFHVIFWVLVVLLALIVVLFLLGYGPGGESTTNLAKNHNKRPPTTRARQLWRSRGGGLLLYLTTIPLTLAF